MHIRYETYLPPPALADVVRFYWAFEIDGFGGIPYIYRSMADGFAELVFHHRGPFQEVTANGLEHSNLASLHAQTARHRRFEVREGFSIFGAYLFPYALPSLAGFSAAAFTDEMPDLQAVWGSDGIELLEQIMLAPNDERRAAILSRFLLARLARGRRPHALAPVAVQEILHKQGQVSITDLSHHLNVSPRQLERIFKDYAGFSPKTYSRILRFQAATGSYGDADKSLTDIALDCGYYDQAHFIHDFRQFSGYTPSEYFKGRPEGIEYREV
jgi:AraC-like DNA-binding protein